MARAAAELKTPLLSDNAGAFSGGRGASGNGVYGGYGTERINPAALNQYTISLKGRVSSHWQLPEIVNKNSGLSAVVALTVRRDGTIEDMWIERRSGDSFFDQSVIKALKNSEPFPGFPTLINKPTLEFALNFTPQGLTL
ncbi:MAG: TonB C-terminal domain-containing protein [Candidatus Electrothrix sp. EH2]|nr:TonB C-terminal domain-containing protein [Candidatus Electrothrix sp. EH2]